MRPFNGDDQGGQTRKTRDYESPRAPNSQNTRSSSRQNDNRGGQNYNYNSNKGGKFKASDNQSSPSLRSRDAKQPNPSARPQSKVESSQSNPDMKQLPKKQQGKGFSSKNPKPLEKKTNIPQHSVLDGKI